VFGAVDDRDVPGAVAEGGDILKGYQLLGAVVVEMLMLRRWNCVEWSYRICSLDLVLLFCGGNKF
jgi:hypothetical protein